MKQLRVFLLFGALLGALAACSLPRGAAIQSEIIGAQKNSKANIAVEPVTRANVSLLQNWPATGWHGHYHWPSAQRGPQSNVIRSGDTVNLTVWDNQLNSLLVGPEAKQTNVVQLRVSPSGEIFVPYLGNLRVSGMTPSGARKHIQEEFEAITPSAQVQLDLNPGPNSTVDLVSGAVKPGNYPLPNRNYQLLSLIALGGGIDSSLRNPIVRLIRGADTYEISAQTLFEKASNNVTLRGKDQVLIVPDQRYFTALGATGSERQVHFTQDKISALEALAILGGINDARANPEGILVLREYPAKSLRADRSGPSNVQTVFTLDLTSADGLFAARNFEINPGDTLLATESPTTAIGTILGLFGSVVGINNAL